MNKENGNRFIDAENKLRMSEGKWVGGWVKKVKRLRSANWQLQNRHRGVKYSTGNIVNNIVITVHSTRWVLELSGGSLCKLILT